MISKHAQNKSLFLSVNIMAICADVQIKSSAQKSENQANFTGSSLGVDGNLSTCAVTSGGENEPWWAVVFGLHHGVLSVELSVRAMTEGPYAVSIPGDEGKIKD